VEFLSFLECQAPPQKCTAPLLKTFWRRFCPEHETRFFGYFLLPETRFFFNYQIRYFKKPGVAVAFKY